MAALLTGMLLVIIPLIVLCQIIAVWRWDVVDDQMFAYFGWRIADGATVYLDVWDNKPPAIYWINAIGMLLGGGSYGGVVAVCVIALLVAHACFFGICLSMFFPGAAAFSTILLSFFLTHAFFTGGTNRTETFLVACELAAVFLYVRGYARDRWWTFFLAGMCCGLAFLFKQVGLAAWGAMGLHTIILVALRNATIRDGLRRCLLLLGGAVATVALAAGYLAAQDALDDAIFAVFTFNRSYFATGMSEWPYNYASWLLLREHFFPILRLPLLMAVAALIHAGLWALRPDFRPPEIEQRIRQVPQVLPHPVVLFTIWFVAAFWGALISPSAFRHYLVAVIPPLLLLAAYLINVLQAEMRLLVRLQQRAWVTAAFVAIAYFSWDALVRQWEEVSKVWVFREMQHRRTEWEIIGDAVAEVTTPDQEIQCWGYFPGVYLEARRINASRFTTTEKVGQVPGQASFVLEQLEQTLKADPPPLVVISSEDYAWMHGELENKPKPEILMGDWIDEHYERIADIPVSRSVYLYKRKDLVQPSDFDVMSRVPMTRRQSGDGE